MARIIQVVVQPDGAHEAKAVAAAPGVAIGQPQRVVDLLEKELIAHDIFVEIALDLLRVIWARGERLPPAHCAAARYEETGDRPGVGAVFGNFIVGVIGKEG
jgi:hypothetical protein